MNVVTRSSALAVLMIAVVALPTRIAAQEPLGEKVADLNRGSLYLSYDKTIYRSARTGDDRLRYAWYMVDDPSMAVQWESPSGIAGAFNGDIDIIPSWTVRAIEVRAIIFDVWKQRLRTLRMIRIQMLEQGDKESFDPQWYDLYGDSHGFASSLIWVQRVLLDDGTILEADERSIVEAAKHIDDQITSDDLLPEKEREAGEVVAE